MTASWLQLVAIGWLKVGADADPTVEHQGGCKRESIGMSPIWNIQERYGSLIATREYSNANGREVSQRDKSRRQRNEGTPGSLQERV